MQKGLKIINRTNTVLFDAAWTAGVDFNEEELNEEEEDPNYESSDNQYNDESEEQEKNEMDRNESDNIINGSICG